MARIADDNEQYLAAVDRCLAVRVAAEIAVLTAMGEYFGGADGEDEAIAEHVKPLARQDADAEVQAAIDNAEECLIARHEYA